jgi:hypothetical protein
MWASKNAAICDVAPIVDVIEPPRSSQEGHGSAVERTQAFPREITTGDSGSKMPNEPPLSWRQVQTTSANGLEW